MVPIEKITGRLGNKMFQFAYIYAQMRDRNIPDIYLQDPKYFDKYQEEIKQLFRPHRDTVIDMVAIHIRRGGNPINSDEPKYSEHPFYVNLIDVGYYERAMALFPDSDFLIFSDDIEWCKDYPSFAGCEFSEGKTELEDMELMASCIGIIIANSSFSFWGAYLSDAIKIVAPSVENWYVDGFERTICPKSWTRI